MPDEKRKKAGWLRAHISKEDEETIKAAAAKDKRSVTSWVERYVVQLAKDQLAEGS